MTNRELYTAILNDTITEEMKTKAREELAKLDARNAARVGKQTKTQKENEPIAQDILTALADKPMLSTDLATAIGQTVSKTNGIALNLVKEGKLTATKVKVKGKGERTEYALAPTEDEGEVAEE